MNRRFFVNRLAPLLVFPVLSAFHVSGQSQNSDTGLTVEEVVKLTRAGFSEDIIITKIKKNGKAFDLSTEELLDLKKDGVSDNAIKYLLDPSLPYTPAPSTAAGTPAAKSGSSAKRYPEDPYASQVPPEPGLYIFPANTPIKTDLKFLLGIEAGKSLMKKGKTIAYLVGASSKTRLKSPKSSFYVRLPEGKQIEELVLISFSEKNGRREIDLGPPGPKQELKADQIQPFDSLEVGPHLFKLTAAKLSPGEYLFFFIGSAEPAKGVYGKGYDFGIDEPQRSPTTKN